LEIEGEGGEILEVIGDRFEGVAAAIGVGGGALERIGLGTELAEAVVIVGGDFAEPIPMPGEFEPLGSADDSAIGVAELFVGGGRPWKIDLRQPVELVKGVSAGVTAGVGVDAEIAIQPGE
jgi:hypothetical protein